MRCHTLARSRHTSSTHRSTFQLRDWSVYISENAECKKASVCIRFCTYKNLFELLRVSSLRFLSVIIFFHVRWCFAVSTGVCRTHEKRVNGSFGEQKEYRVRIVIKWHKCDTSSFFTPPTLVFCQTTMWKKSWNLLRLQNNDTHTRQ